MVKLNTYDALEKNGILHEWNYEKNKELGHTPYNISLHSHKKIWWKCALNHEWQDTLDHRLLRGDSCPYCSGHRVLVGFNDLSTTCPNLIKEWDFEKNNALGFFPEKLSAGSRTKVWWKCSICKNSWQSTIKDRLRGRGGAVCSSRVIISGYNDLASNYPYLLKEWDYAKNNADIDPNDMAKNSNKSVWWKCKFLWRSPKA